ncbi:MAG: hypothetical protein P3X22_007425 [Thermoprotei archaeon]|nr:hypothetical protein [Thermoprotei archaeon]
MKHVVVKHVLLTATIALIGAVLALAGGNIRSPVTLIGLAIVAASPIVSYIITYIYFRRLFKASSGAS